MNFVATRPALDAGIDLSDVLFATGYDSSVRAQPGERFEQVFEERVDVLAAAGSTTHLAIDSSEGQLTYAELDARANQLARHLKTHGIGSGDRVALLFDKSVFSYIATLAVLKVNAAYVPLDQSFPADRIAFIADDAGCKAILSIARYREHLAPTGLPVLHLDDDLAAIEAQPQGRLCPDEKGAPKEDLAYIIYTSGTTGKPKGVPIDHQQIVNFLRVAAEVYGLSSNDRMYQGLTIAFDFAIEEIWVPLAVGATLVPGPAGARLLGKDLGDYLAERQITALCCVPTLLATLEADLPLLSYIMVSGEACPQDLVARWQKPGRIFLNAYGPTEATVTATLTALEAGKPVTIGGPLPSYSIVMLDPDQPRILKRGETGEIGIAGVGVARGYLNRDEQTRKAFIEDFIGIPGNQSGRIYRTGDLGRINADGEIEYMGRIDTQVKIRGYRIELTEIESVLMKFPGIAQAVVNKYEATPGAVELAAYYTLKPGVHDFNLDAMVEELRQHVPAYMVPAYFERLDAMPLLPSHKADRKKLPPPSGPRYSARKGALVAPEGQLETSMAEALAATLKLDEVSVEDHFFDDMGANSLLMAQFCTRLREAGLVGDVSMRDTYMQPTIRRLATHLSTTAPATPLQQADVPAAYEAPRWHYALTAFAQLVSWFAYLSFAGWVLIETFDFTFGARGVVETYLRAASATLAMTLVMVAAPVALKWLLVGRWKPDTFPVWGLKYYRFWLLKQLLRFNPMVAFAGTPLYNVYLRLLGARIGRDAAIMSGSLPIATDLVNIGERALVSKSASLSGYRVRGGMVEVGAISIGDHAYIGESTVLSVNTAVGDGAQLGNSSALYSGQSVPAGKIYHGSPAVEATTNYDRVPPLPVGRLRRIAYSVAQIVWLYLVLIPVPTAALLAFFPGLAEMGDLHLDGQDMVHFHLGEILGGTFLLSAVAFVLALPLGLLAIRVLPRLAWLFLEPGKVYPLYSIPFFLMRFVSATSNSTAFNNLFGDSSLITWFLEWIGWNLNKVNQSGSNFGAAQKHDIPFLSNVGSGTMVSDGLTMVNVDMSSTSFVMAEARIGTDNYLGNAITYPAGGRTGDNVLMATKVLVPLDGPVRENCGLLGSPAFEIPRSVKRDAQFDHLRSGPEFETRLKQKNASNLRTMGWHLLVRFIFGYVGLVLFVVAIAEQPLFGPFGLAAAAMLTVIFGVMFYALVDRITLGFGRLEPRHVSIYDPYYWFHERQWKVADITAIVPFFAGTPFAGMLWRLFGVRVGRQLFDDGSLLTERTLVEIGDHVTLGDRVTLQSHTLEDAAFKSGFIRLGNGVSIGSNCYVNYEVVMGDGASLEPDSFLMKGEQVPAGSAWGGNPARQLQA